MRLREILCGTALAVCAASSGAQDTSAFAAIRDSIRAIMAAQNLPSIAVAVAKGDRILWEEGFGYANREKQIKATPETIYSLASISKPFTATGMMVLVERGKIDIDHPANEYLGMSKLRVYEGDASSITLRRILSHSAGLPLHYQFFYEGGPKQISDDEAIAHYGFSAYPPGDAYFYSNLGFGIIGHINERVGGEPYAQYMRDEVFEPLGLHNTLVSSGAGLGDRAAVRYDNDLTVLKPYVFDHMGASAVWSSAHDLVRFGMFHVGATVPGQRQIISKETRAKMQRAESPPSGPGTAYGLGWGTLEDDGGYRRISHTGGMPGVSTFLNLYPSEQLVIVVLVNRANASGAPRVSNMIAGALLPGYNAKRARALEAARARAATTTPPARDPARFNAILGVWTGSILVERDTVRFVITVKPDADIHVGFGNQLPVVLSNGAVGDGMFTGSFQAPLRAPDATPDSARSRVVASMTLRVRGDQMTGWVSSITQGGLAYGAVSYFAKLTRQQSNSNTGR
ncbi:MAG TPA: serine hydrolase domain-containing protein [Gemmatimonadaceae bacterium]|nr:serine hydrolase domain-containing protein [Gemmatimonadaceae bacterium]